LLFWLLSQRLPSARSRGIVEMKDRLTSALGALVILIATGLVILGIMLVAIPALVITWAMWIWDQWVWDRWGLSGRPRRKK
jgi:hypothetical protein